MKRGEPYTYVMPYTPEQVFDVVADVRRYPEFLPWCKGARILSSDATTMTADLIIGYGPFNETFTSKVTFDRPHAIHVDYVKGPLNQLSTDWTFKSLDDGKATEITVCVDFDFKTFILRKLMESVFEQAFSTLSDAFTKRTREIVEG